MKSNSTKKRYSGDLKTFESKLARVMARLGAGKYTYDWAQTRGGSSCYVEMVYKGSTYRFENSTEKSATTGRNLVYPSDLFAAVVYSLEGLARAIEQEIFTLDMLLSGVPTLPAANPVEPCFVAMGFTARPETAEDVKTHYRMLAKALHPDAGGDTKAFQALQDNYNLCLQLMNEGME